MRVIEGAASAGLGAVGRREEPSPTATGLLGELRHLYLLPDLPPDVLAVVVPADESEPAMDSLRTPAAARADVSWEQVFEHVRRLVARNHRSAA